MTTTRKTLKAWKAAESRLALTAPLLVQNSLPDAEFTAWWLKASGRLTPEQSPALSGARTDPPSDGNER